MPCTGRRSRASTTSTCRMPLASLRFGSLAVPFGALYFQVLTYRIATPACFAFPFCSSVFVCCATCCVCVCYFLWFVSGFSSFAATPTTWLFGFKSFMATTPLLPQIDPWTLGTHSWMCYQLTFQLISLVSSGKQNSQRCFFWILYSLPFKRPNGIQEIPANWGRGPKK